MTVLLARAKQYAKWLLAVAALVAMAAWAIFRKRPQSVLKPHPLDEALNRYERQTAVASARAAVEIASARTTLKTEQARLMDILRDQDEDRRNDRLIEEAKRLRGDP